ncbi:MAG: hypothetical protein U0325_15020 [Polyangiales bacterium]
MPPVRSRAAWTLLVVASAMAACESAATVAAPGSDAARADGATLSDRDTPTDRGAPIDGAPADAPVSPPGDAMGIDAAGDGGLDATGIDVAADVEDPVVELSVDPATATLRVTQAMTPQMQPFTARARTRSGRSAVVPAVWTVDRADCRVDQRRRRRHDHEPLGR